MKIKQKLALCWRILRHKPSNLYNHAVRELPPVDDDEIQEWMNSSVLELVFVFETQGHSGFSAPYAIATLEKALSFEPLSPLTGEDNEWVCVDEGLLQNKRCSRVFKDDTGAYDVEGKIFREPSGACYTSIESRVPVQFPYTPTTTYIDVPEVKE